MGVSIWGNVWASRASSSASQFNCAGRVSSSKGVPLSWWLFIHEIRTIGTCWCVVLMCWMTSQSDLIVSLGNSGRSWFSNLLMLSTRASLSHTSFNGGRSPWPGSNRWHTDFKIEQIPNASAWKEVMGKPNALPLFFTILKPSGVLIIQPKVPFPLLTDPSLAPTYGLSECNHCYFTVCGSIRNSTLGLRNTSKLWWWFPIFKTTSSNIQCVVNSTFLQKLDSYFS